ncbi:phosphodiester glycosidase family protein [Streptomyces sp. H10-C2]|uniref:phosphodiester glycosidase family protein n=1 Tax=unclassified Streptomyces TaxID=2593676 RepID=UPI0024BBDD7A|nr:MULTISPECIES: phosphodiester glycosidase family protein [unclassified Streptomyces]MDJ0347191.1 phosphodiester glycosidase family protein [Streptomyces sp. PH10-H1]MDJ0370336.1 phosphodiester glycosidase family protein [Streptomyces sp. H10-C2]
MTQGAGGRITDLQETTERDDGTGDDVIGSGARRRRRLVPWKPKRDLTPAQLRRRLAVTRGALAVSLVCVGTVGWSVGKALTYPGKDSVLARLAEWSRDHSLGVVVDKLEDLQYQLNPPEVGGSLPAGALARMKATDPANVRTPALPLREPMRPIVTPGLPGEGVWRAVASSKGLPIVQATYVRPDDEHTSYQAAIAWISTKHARFQLHPGFREPGGTFSVPPTIPPGQRTGLVATWNGGFRVTDGGSHGGFYLNGETAGELRYGTASEVFYRDGSIKIGVWGREFSMTPEVVGVRQCLDLMVDDGQVVPDIGNDAKWGVTDQSRMYVERSGVGVTAEGDIIMVVGQALTARTLAELMQQAGAVRAMPLDMNRAWPSFMAYDGSRNPANPTPTNLLDFENPPDRYYVQATRDFVAVYGK